MGRVDRVCGRDVIRLVWTLSEVRDVRVEQEAGRGVIWLVER